MITECRWHAASLAKAATTRRHLLEALLHEGAEPNGARREGGGGMSRGAKDSAEVVEFMTLFARLKHWSDDAPEELADLAATDTSAKELCIQLSFAARFLKMNERRAQALFAAPVDPAFLAAWRDYEERYETVVSGDLAVGSAAGTRRRRAFQRSQGGPAMGQRGPRSGGAGRRH